MKRCFLHLALFLVLGAVINYALAMGIIWFGPVGEGKRDGGHFHGSPVQRVITPGMTMVLFVPVDVGRSSLESGEVPAWSRVHHLSRPLLSNEEWWSHPDPPEHLDVASGWPRRSLIYGCDFYDRRPPGTEVIITSGIELPPRSRSGTGPFHPAELARAIPLRIIPVGFALNTLLFASLAAMMWYAPGAIRRIRRRRANRCLKCGYSRAGLAAGAVCPECGAA